MNTKEPFLIINTSSPDRSMDVVPKLFKEIKERVPQARMVWCYGWDGFVNTYSNDAKKMSWMNQVKKEIADAGIEDLGRITQEEVGKLYQKASILFYPTHFAEIDCLSVKKAQAAGCYPITTDFAALGTSNVFGFKSHTKKTKDNWNRPYQFSFGCDDEEEQTVLVDAVVSQLTNPKLMDEKKVKEWSESLSWEEVSKKWQEQFV